jgi:hypothetical protein
VNGFLTQLAQKTAERWLALLVLPGVLFAAVAGFTWLMADPFDPAPAAARIDAWFARPAGSSTVLAVTAFLAGAVLSGYAARALAQLVEWAWFTPRLGPLGRGLTTLRRWWWNRLDDRYWTALKAGYRGSTTADPDAAMAARDRFCPVPPARPTWLADRIRATGERVFRFYGLDLVSLWPRLWLAVPDGVRTELTAARTALTADARLFAWGLLYLMPGVYWWPALLVTAVACPVAVVRARGATQVLADLVEATVDLHAGEVAAKLGFPVEGPLRPETGKTVTQLFQRD